MILYLLENNISFFSPNLEIGGDSYFVGQMNSLLEDMVEIKSCMARVAEDNPPYNVFSYL